MAGQPPTTRPWFRLANLGRQPPAPAPAPAPQAPVQPPPPPPQPRPPLIRPAFRPTFTRSQPSSPPPPVTAPPSPPRRVASTPPPPPPATTPPSPPRRVASPPPPPPPATTPPSPPRRVASPPPPPPPAKTPPSPPRRVASPPPPPPPATTPPSPPRPIAFPPPPPPPPTATPPSPPRPIASPPQLPSVSRSPPPPPSPRTIPSPGTTMMSYKPAAMSPPQSPTKTTNSPPSPFSLPPQLKPVVFSGSSKEDQAKVKGIRSYNDSNKLGKPNEDEFTSDSSDSGSVRIITIKGDNRGALMELDFSPKSRRGRVLGSDNEDRSKTKDQKGYAESPHQPLSAYMNSNVQSVNNSILYDCSYSHHDPGVHWSLSRQPVKGNKRGFYHKNHESAKQL